jgi:hypothetical protein
MRGVIAGCSPLLSSINRPVRRLPLFAASAKQMH